MLGKSSNNLLNKVWKVKPIFLFSQGHTFQPPNIRVYPQNTCKTSLYKIRAILQGDIHPLGDSHTHSHTVTYTHPHLHTDHRHTHTETHTHTHTYSHSAHGCGWREKKWVKWELVGVAEISLLHNFLLLIRTGDMCPAQRFWIEISKSLWLINRLPVKI